MLKDFSTSLFQIKLLINSNFPKYKTKIKIGLVRDFNVKRSNVNKDNVSKFKF